MQEYLKHYRIRLTALSPIHVGNGSQIGKKEYFIDTDKNLVIIPNMGKMLTDLRRLNREKAFEAFMLEEKNSDLLHWLLSQRINSGYIDKWKSYTLNAGDVVAVRGKGKISKPKDIRTFYKDAYGLAYIPGSTLKGLLRSVLITGEVNRNLRNYRALTERLKADAMSASDYNRKSYLKRDIDSIETAVFNTLSRPDRNKADAVNSVMAGLIISDSEPIPTEQLSLCQKIDYSTDGNVHALNILRESIIPGTEVYFDLTIDTKLFPYSVEDILNAIDIYSKYCYEYFYKRFGRGSAKPDVVWIGGGTGFISKTILYQIYGADAVKITDAVFRKTISSKNYRLHKHDADVRNGISPHICKCTYYKGQLYDMGMGRLEIIDG